MLVLKWDHAAQIGHSPLGAVVNTLRFAFSSMLLAVFLGTALATSLPRCQDGSSIVETLPGAFGGLFGRLRLCHVACLSSGSLAVS